MMDPELDRIKFMTNIYLDSALYYIRGIKFEFPDGFKLLVHIELGIEHAMP